MRRLLQIVLPLALLAGCEGGAAPPSALSGPAAQLRASFPPRGLVDTIEIDAIERLPLRAAVLVAPDGTTTPATYINTDTNPRLATGQWAAGNAWQDAITGNSALAALMQPNIPAGTAPHGEQQLLAVVSTANITLPDPVAYRRDWQHYRIRLTFGTAPGEVETQEIAAPAPPQ